MITKERFWDIIPDVVRNPEALDESDWEKVIDAVIEEVGWKNISTAPKNRPILMWAYSSAEWWKLESRKRMCMCVEWDIGWKQWYTIDGGASDEDGSKIYAEDPIAWMELPKYEV